MNRSVRKAVTVSVLTVGCSAAPALLPRASPPEPCDYPPTPTSASRRSPGPVVGRFWLSKTDSDEIGWVDPVSLLPVSKQRVSVPEQTFAWALAADGRRLAVAGSRGTWLVDVERMARLGTRRIEGAATLAWLSDDRLATVSYGGALLFDASMGERIAAPGVFSIPRTSRGTGSRRRHEDMTIESDEPWQAQHLRSSALVRRLVGVIEEAYPGQLSIGGPRMIGAASLGQAILLLGIGAVIGVAVSEMARLFIVDPILTRRRQRDARADQHREALARLISPLQSAFEMVGRFSETFRTARDQVDRPLQFVGLVPEWNYKVIRTLHALSSGVGDFADYFHRAGLELDGP